MTNGNTSETNGPDFRKYGYGALAGSLIGSEPEYADGALRTLAGLKGLALGEEAEGFVDTALSTEQGVQTAANIYAVKFQEARGKLKPSDLVSWYNPTFSDLDGTVRKKIVESLGSYNENIGDIQKKFVKAQTILKNQGVFSDDEVSAANKDAKKYKEVMTIMSTLDRYTFESMRPDAVEVTRKNDLEALAKQL
jgi:hypothetical protein